MIPHLVVTRLMVGIARPAAFLLHTETLIETLLPSMAAQSFEDFHWVIITDRHIDPQANERLREAIEPFENFHIEYMDPFTTGINHIDLAPLAVKYLGTTRNVITTRVDDDDTFSTDYLECVQAEIAPVIRSREVMVACSSLSTIGVSPTQRLFGAMKNDSPSAGMSLFSPDVSKKHVHSFNHRKIHTIISERGGLSIKIDSAQPQLLTGVYFDSDSREVRDQSVAKARANNRLKPIDEFQPEFKAALQRFALSESFLDQITHIRQTYVDHRPPIFIDPAPGMNNPSTRLDLKNRYFALAKPHIQAIKKGDGTEEEKQQARLMVYLMKQAYYLV